MKLHLPFGIRQRVSDNATYISKEEYREISEYAVANHIRLEGFKSFKGNVNDVLELIDDIITISKDFPQILVGKKSVVLSLDGYSAEDDFATTIRHIVYLNARLYNDVNYLKLEYETAMIQGKFVEGTDFHSIIRHEIGHIVANTYNITTMEIAKKVLPGLKENEILMHVRDNLSLYAAEYEDGREFISESFSAYYSGVNNDFAKKYVEACKEYIKEKEVTEYDKK